MIWGTSIPRKPPCLYHHIVETKLLCRLDVPVHLSRWSIPCIYIYIYVYIYIYTCMYIYDEVTLLVPARFQLASWPNLMFWLPTEKHSMSQTWGKHIRGSKRKNMKDDAKTFPKVICKIWNYDELCIYCIKCCIVFSKNIPDVCKCSPHTSVTQTVKVFRAT